MKKVFYLLAGIISLVSLNSSESAGQPHNLRIVRIDNFPDLPADTAFEGAVYPNIRVLVTNTGTSPFFGDIDVYLYSNALGSASFDTLRGGPLPHVFLDPNAGDTVSLPANPNYRFKNIHYAAGDNIIVVWPYNVNTSFDTLQTDVYFVPLGTVAIDEPEQHGIILYKNPVAQVLQLNYLDEKSVEQVRIYDVMGRELFRIDKAIAAIDVSSFKSGIYLLEMVQKDGTHSVKKILIAGN